MRMKGSKNPNAGRPKFNGRSFQEVIDKVESVWAIGGTDAEAAFFADIDKATLCRLLKNNPKILQRKEALKERPIMLSRQTVIKAIEEGDADLALKYLERKKKDEFSERKELVVDDDKRTEWAREAMSRPELADEIASIMSKLEK